MSTYLQVYYHLIFAPKHRRPVFLENRRRDLFAYIWGVIKNKKCHLYRIGGTEDHIHILSDLHPSVCLGDYIKDIKISSGGWIKEGNVFPGFDYWQEGYGGFTHSHAERDGLIEYIKGQEEHHKVMTFQEEYLKLLREAGLEPDPRFIE
ncbi:MAG: IS200/IS605 family transposase [Candidatus Sumerlaeota bacterium]|nr:IS200/IS605 family transposase [Candidatus Sumerlaeota bacterium]